MVTEGAKNYTYDTFGNLASVGNSSSAQYTRIYDSAMNPMTHIDSVNNMRYNYEYEGIGRPVLATKRDLVAQKNYQYYLITNTRGDIIETRNGDGNVNAKFVYDAWGKLISVTNASGTPLASDSFAYQISLKYRGYVYDNETGLYYLQSRYYDPETGRFLNADDVEYIGVSGTVLGYNAFAYCENNAVNDSDPWGYVGMVQWISAYVHYIQNYLITLFTSPTNRNSYIYNQYNSYVSNMNYGGFKISFNGCELIAVYNVLHKMNKKEPFYKIIHYAEINDWYLFPVVPTGAFGTSFTKVKQLFREKGLSYTEYSGPQSGSFEEDIKQGRICIGVYSNEYPITGPDAIYNFSIHSFAFYYDKNTRKYIAFNGYNPSSDPYKNSECYDSYDAMILEGRFFLYGYIFN